MSSPPRGVGGGGPSIPLGRNSPAVLYPQGPRTGLPGGVLQSANLTPEMLANNMRAGLFPEKGQRIRNTIEQSLIRQAWSEVSALERLHIRSCPQPKLRAIRTVRTAAAAAAASVQTKESDTSSAAPVDASHLPLPTRLYSRLFVERPFPHLTIFKAPPLPSSASPAEQPTPASALPPPPPPPSPPTAAAIDPLQSAPPSVVFYGPRSLGSELWTVDRCGADQSYLVAYYGDGDAFYSDVYPVNWSGAFDCIRLRIKQWAETA